MIISNVPPFIPDDEIKRALSCFGKFASPLKTIPLGCKNTALKHVMSFRRQVAMFLNQPDLEVSFRVSYEGKTYMVYASTGSLKCFDCGFVGHKRSACPHKAGSSGVGVTTNSTVDLVVSESNGEQTTPKEIKESDGNEVASCSSVRQGENILDKTEETGESLGVETCKDSEVVQMNEVVNVEMNTMLNYTEEVEEEGMRDDDMLSDISEVGSQKMEDMYSLDEINDFLDTTFGKVVEVEDFFPDVEKFIFSVKVLQRAVSYDVLSKQKRFRLKKIVTKLRKNKGPFPFKK